jgi:hypothetical protein
MSAVSLLTALDQRTKHCSNNSPPSPLTERRGAHCATNKRKGFENACAGDVRRHASSGLVRSLPSPSESVRATRRIYLSGDSARPFRNRSR